MFIAALFVIAKQHKCSLTDKWINKMHYIHTVDCFSAIKKKEEILSYATTLMNIEDIMLSERNHFTEGKHCMILLPEVVRLTELESRMVVARSWGRRK